MKDLRSAIRKCMIENQEREERLKSEMGDLKRELAKSGTINNRIIKSIN